MAFIPLNGTEFTCLCEKQKGWVIDGCYTDYCPSCGRRYIGKYNEKTLQIDAICIGQEEGMIDTYKRS